MVQIVKCRLWLAIPLGLLLYGCGPGGEPGGAGEAGLSDHPAAFALDYDQLTGPLSALGDAERDAVSDTIELIKSGEYTLALSRLSSLGEGHPENTSLRIMTSYALLLAGNLTGAFEEAEKAHETDGRISYKCWFLAKVALATGHRATCERELQHLHSVGELAQAREIEAEFAQQFGAVPAQPSER